jgi:hypothetical protein
MSAQMTNEQILHLWDTHVGTPNEKYPLREKDILLFAEDLRMAEAALRAQGEPVAWMFQHDETGRNTFVDQWQLDNGWEANNPRWVKVCAMVKAPHSRIEAWIEANQGEAHD